jgi:hypothetical protein
LILQLPSPSTDVGYGFCRSPNGFETNAHTAKADSEALGLIPKLFQRLREANFEVNSEQIAAAAQ